MFRNIRCVVFIFLSLLAVGFIPTMAFAAESGTLLPASEVWRSTGLYGFASGGGLGKLTMIGVSLVLIYLAVKKQYEPLLLLTIGFGGLLCNIPLAGINEAPNGFLYQIYNFGINSGLFPLFIFMGVGAMTDFGPLIANPRTMLLGAAAQFGIFAALLGALALGQFGIDFSLKDAASIGIIGGADGPTVIYTTGEVWRGALPAALLVLLAAAAITIWIVKRHKGKHKK